MGYTSKDPDQIARQLLAALYESHAEWCANLPLACGKGCSSCCTQSVTITGLEAWEILSYLKQENRLPELDDLLSQRKPGPAKGLLTTNEFADYCLRGITPEEPVHEEWDFSPCPFLHQQSCSIYPARPFACRAFISTVPCFETGSAEVPPLALTVNTVFTQLVEHLAQGSKWGKMLDILASYHSTRQGPDKSGPDAPLRDAKPIPGLIVCEEEEKAIEAILGRFLGKSLQNGKVKDFLKLPRGV